MDWPGKEHCDDDLEGLLHSGFWIEMTAVPYVIWERSVSEKGMTLITRQTASPKTVRLRVIVMATALAGLSLPTGAEEPSLKQLASSILTIICLPALALMVAGFRLFPDTCFNRYFSGNHQIHGDRAQFSPSLE